MIETLEKRLAELQQDAQRQQAILLQITGAIQEVANLISKLKEAQNAAETRNE